MWCSCYNNSSIGRPSCLFLCFTDLEYRNNAYSLHLHLYVFPSTTRRLWSENVSVHDFYHFAFSTVFLHSDSAVLQLEFSLCIAERLRCCCKNYNRKVALDRSLSTGTGIVMTPSVCRTKRLTCEYASTSLYSFCLRYLESVRTDA